MTFGGAMDGATPHAAGSPAIAPRDRASAARALGLFLAVGGVFLALGALVPGFGGRGVVLAATVAVAVIVLVAGAVCLRAPATVPTFVLAASPVVGALLIGGLNLATRDSSTGSQLFLLWPILYAASFLDLRRTTIVVGTVVAVEGAVMAVLERPSDAVTDAGGLAFAFSLAALAIIVQRRRIGRLLEALEVQAREDPVTGLPNRRAFDEQIGRALVAARRGGGPLSLIVLDVDRFKEVNDLRGHLAGDAALRSVAHALRSATRAGDGLARLGGDEFAVLLADCDADDARRVARLVTSQVSIGTRTAGEPLTVSVGIATSVAGHATTPEELLAASDAALYRAKLRGGDQVAAADGPPAAPLAYRGGSPS